MKPNTIILILCLVIFVIAAAIATSVYRSQPAKDSSMSSVGAQMPDDKTTRESTTPAPPAADVTQGTQEGAH
jgi:uncharacterized membrane protein